MPDDRIRVVSAFDELITHAITADAELFTQEETNLVARFKALPASAQYLYIRLFYRKPKSFTRYDYERYFSHSYKTSVDDVDVLVRANLFTDSTEVDVPSLLKSLTVEQLKSLEKQSSIRKLKTSGNGGETTAGKSLTEKQRILKRFHTIMANKRIGQGDDSGLSFLKSAIISSIGPICVLESHAQSVFQLMLRCTLSACHVSIGDLFRWSQLDIKPMPLNQAVLHNTTRLFSTRQQLEAYHAASELASIEDQQQQQQNWSNHTAQDWANVFPKAVERAQHALAKLQDEIEYTQVYSLPHSIRKYSADAVYFRLLVSIAENMKDTDKETLCLDLFLSQDLYYPEKRPKALLRKFQTALLRYSKSRLDSDFSTCLDICIELRFDSHLSNVDQLEFERKAKRLNDYCRPQDKEILTEIRSEIHAKIGRLKVAKEVPVVCERLNEVKLGQPTRWADDSLVAHLPADDDDNSQNNGSSRTSVSVETVALNHYRKQNWHGVHAENAIVSALFFLLFWDIVYDQSLPNVFYHKYQPYPIDLTVRDEFYASRKMAIENRLALIESDIEFSISHLRHAYKQNIKTLCGCSYWQFELEELVVIAQGIGPKGLAMICSRLSQDYRTYRSGAPDLILWNMDTRQCKFVEVKSDNDTLSDNQRVYIHDLLTAGVDVELCKVRQKSALKRKRANK